MTSPANTRLLAPDLARGFTLLGIAIANATTAWLIVGKDTPAFLSGGIVDGSVLDKIAVFLGAIFIHVRGLPMFATLMGYGVGMIAMSLQRRDYPPKKARRILLRRYFFLGVFGLIHMCLLFFGDIMMCYGVAGMILALLSRFKDKTLLIIAAVMASLTTIAGIALSILIQFAPTQSTANMPFDLPVANSYAEQLAGAGRVLTMQLTVAIPGPIVALMSVMLLGLVAARNNVLGQPEKYVKQLRWAVIVAAVVAFGVGIPLGLAEIGVLPDKAGLSLFLLNQLTGPLTGPGIVASIALISMRIDARATTPPAALQAVVALGKRSMTGYLLQSILFTVFTATYTLGLGRNQGAWEASLVGAGIWLITVLIAYAMDKANMRGPFEVLHRRLSYGKNGLATPTQ